MTRSRVFPVQERASPPEESVASRSGFPRVDFHSSRETLLFHSLIQEKQRGRGEKKWGITSSRELRGEGGLGFHRVDWRGFGPLNRSTCSARISRRQGSILVEWGCFPSCPGTYGRLREPPVQDGHCCHGFLYQPMPLRSLRKTFESCCCSNWTFYF